VEITDGVELGEQVIRAGHVGLTDGSRVQAVVVDGDDPEEGNASQPGTASQPSLPSPQDEQHATQNQQPSQQDQPPTQQDRQPAPSPEELASDVEAATSPVGSDVGHMRIGDIAVGEQLSRRLVNRVISSGRDRLLRCYRTAFGQNPSLGVQSLSITMSVGVDGMVSDARATPAGPLASCLGEEVGELRFPEQRGEGSEEVSLSLTFTPERTR
jgi:hypothetical protein